MSNVLFLGDAHLGHKSITKYRTLFRDEQDHFEHIEIEYHKVVTKRDKCIFTGDAVFTEDRLRQMQKWAGTKVLIIGNHDTDSINMKTLAECFDDMYGLLKYKEFWVSHAPIHPVELRGKANIHGHVHNQNIQDIRYFNTSLENIGYKPISLFEIRAIMAKRKEYVSRYGTYNVEWDKLK